MSIPGASANSAVNFAEQHLPAHREFFASLYRQAQIGQATRDTTKHARQSHLGGSPMVPNGFEWPRTADDFPLTLLGQIWLGECQLPSLPSKGSLLFFATVVEGEISAQFPDDGAVRWVPDSSGPSGQLREVTAPTSYLGGKSIPTSERDVPLRHVPLEFTSAEMLPSEDATLFAADGIALSPQQARAWRDIANATMPNASPIWLGGYPALLQDDLTPYCVHQAAGIESLPLDEEIQLSPEVLRAAKDWVLLAQFNRDEGSAYFYMSRQALHAREFDKAQLWVQRD